MRNRFNPQDENQQDDNQQDENQQDDNQQDDLLIQLENLQNLDNLENLENLENQILQNIFRRRQLTRQRFNRQRQGLLTWLILLAIYSVVVALVYYKSVVSRTFNFVKNISNGNAADNTKDLRMETPIFQFTAASGTTSKIIYEINNLTDKKTTVKGQLRCKNGSFNRFVIPVKAKSLAQGNMLVDQECLKKEGALVESLSAMNEKKSVYYLESLDIKDAEISGNTEGFYKKVAGRGIREGESLNINIQRQNYAGHEENSKDVQSTNIRDDKLSQPVVYIERTPKPAPGFFDLGSQPISDSFELNVKIGRSIY